MGSPTDTVQDGLGATPGNERDLLASVGRPALDVGTWELLEEIEGTALDGFMIFERVGGSRAHPLDFRCLYLNPAAERIFHREANELIGRRLLAEMTWVRDSSLPEVCSRVVETGKPSVCELCV